MKARLKKKKEYFQPYTRFPTDGISQATSYSISMASALKSYINDPTKTGIYNWKPPRHVHKDKSS